MRVSNFSKQLALRFIIQHMQNEDVANERLFDMGNESSPSWAARVFCSPPPNVPKNFFGCFFMLILWAKLCQQRLLTEFSGCGASSMETLLTVSGLLLELSLSSFLHNCEVLLNLKNVEAFAVCRTAVVSLLDHCSPQFQLSFSLACRVWTWTNIAFY